MRKTIMSILKELYPTYPVNTHKGKCKKPYYVVKFNESNTTNNSLGVLQGFEVMAYVPDSSILPLDDMLEQTIKPLSEIAEYTGFCTGDFHDEDKEAYMKSYKFIFPKVLE